MHLSAQSALIRMTQISTGPGQILTCTSPGCQNTFSQGSNFIPSPFWLISVDPFVKDCADKVRRRQQELTRIYEGVQATSSTRKRSMMLQRTASTSATSGKAMPPMHNLIGTFSEKLGFGTGALNTDGAFKLNFDPSKACRYRGGVHYKSVCTAYQVLYNHGTTAISVFDKPRGRRRR